MNCRKVKKLLINYSGSLLRKPLSETNGLKEGKKLTDFPPLPKGGRGDLEEHLSLCPECRRKLVSLERTERLLFAIPLKKPPNGLWDSLRARIVAEESPSEFGIEKSIIPKCPELAKEHRIPNSFAALTVSVILLIFVGFFFLRPFFNSQESISPDGLASIYVEQHALRAWRDPLADRAWLGWSVQLIVEEAERLGSP